MNLHFKGAFFISMLDLTQPIRTIGLHQPYAGLMLHGKEIETRWIINGRKAPFPLGPYLIYATKNRYDDQAIEAVGGINQAERIKGIRDAHHDDLHRKGEALCIGNLIRVIDPLNASYIERSFVEQELYQDTCYRLVGLEFDAMHRIEPFAFKGKQGIGFLTVEDRAKIRFVS